MGETAVTTKKSPTFADRVRSAKAAGLKAEPKKLKYTPPADCRRSSEYWDYMRDGVTKSSLEKFLLCREQFRLGYVEGYAGKGCNLGFSFGNVLHWLIARHLDLKVKRIPVAEQTGLFHGVWLRDHKNPTSTQKDTMEMAYLLAEAIWPYYTTMWPDDQSWKWVRVEDSFNVPLTDAGTIMRGIYDGVCKRDSGVWIFETKGMSRVDEGNIEQTLPFSLQNMMYVVAYWLQSGEFPAGIIYNVIRRPGQEMKQKESFAAFRDRIQADIEKRPEFYFMRWEIEITKTQIERWYSQVFMPILMDLKQWSEGGIHYMNPDALVTKYGRCDLFDVMVNDNYAFVERKPVSSRYER
jgi:hypothetical protein